MFKTLSTGASSISPCSAWPLARLHLQGCNDVHACVGLVFLRQVELEREREGSLMTNGSRSFVHARHACLERNNPCVPFDFCSVCCCDGVRKTNPPARSRDRFSFEIDRLLVLFFYQNMFKSIKLQKFIIRKFGLFRWCTSFLCHLLCVSRNPFTRCTGDMRINFQLYSYLFLN